MFALIGRLTQPLKALYWAFLVVFAGNVVTLFLGGERAATLVNGSLGLVSALIGLTLVLDVNGGAESLAEASKHYRPWGIDYSRSPLASPRFTRLFGVGMLAVGIVFVSAAVSQL